MQNDKFLVTIQYNGTVAPVEKAIGRMDAAVEPQGRVYAALGMGGAIPSNGKLNNSFFFEIDDNGVDSATNEYPSLTIKSREVVMDSKALEDFWCPLLTTVPGSGWE